MVVASGIVYSLILVRLIMNQHPNLIWYQYDTSEIADPSGARDGTTAFAFQKVVGSGVCVSGLSFPTVTLNLSEGYKDGHVSVPTALLFRLNSVTDGSGINDFHFYMSENSALNNDGNEPKPFIQMTNSGIWQPNCVMPSGTGTKLTLNNITTSPNVFRQDGKLFIDGIGDLDASQYIYLNVVVPDRQELGTFGICGSGNLSFTLKYTMGDV